MYNSKIFLDLHTHTKHIQAELILQFKNLHPIGLITHHMVCVLTTKLSSKSDFMD